MLEKTGEQTNGPADATASDTVSRGNPWPRASSILFLINTEHDFEIDLIKAWLETTKPDGTTTDAEYAYLRPTKDGTLVYEGARATNDEQLVVPLGLVWRAPNRPANDTLRRARLIGGIPSTAFGKKRALSKDPMSCVRVAGEPATLSALRARYRLKTGETAVDNELYEFIARQAVLTVEREARGIDGAPMKLPRFVVPAIMSRREFRAELTAIAQAENRNIDEVIESARKCLDEIAPAPTRIFVQLMARIAKLINMRPNGFRMPAIYPKNHARLSGLLTAPACSLAYESISGMRS